MQRASTVDQGVSGAPAYIPKDEQLYTAQLVDSPQIVMCCLPMAQCTSSRRHQYEVQVDTDKGGGKWVFTFSFNMTRQIISFAKDTPI